MEDQKKSTNKPDKPDELREALKIVKEAIAEREKKYQGYLDTEENDPVMVEGETQAGYCCQIMVDPKEVAKIFLDYQYPVWDVLEEDAPLEMWDDLARKFGLSTVSSVDL